MVLGAVGTGKTSACMYPYVNQLLRWRSADPDWKIGGLVLEVKGDFCGQVRSMLRRAGREADYVVIESFSPRGGPSVTIKTHHNVGGLKPDMKFKLIEPLRELFKDEVRNVGRELGLPEEMVGRHPFPGPGLGIRVLGAVSRPALDTLRRADAIYLEEIREANLYQEIWQAFAVLLPVRSVGVMGDYRTYENVVALRAVTSTDGMTADIYPFDATFLSRVATRIVNEVRGINRVVYDYTSKPPGTIEWE